jgi:hypothetical protein
MNTLPPLQAETVAIHVDLGWTIERQNHFAGTVVLTNRSSEYKTIDQYGQILEIK